MWKTWRSSTALSCQHRILKEVRITFFGFQICVAGCSEIICMFLAIYGNRTWGVQNAKCNTIHLNISISNLELMFLLTYFSLLKSHLNKYIFSIFVVWSTPLLEQNSSLIWYHKMDCVFRNIEAICISFNWWQCWSVSWHSYSTAIIFSLFFSRSKILPNSNTITAASAVERVQWWSPIFRSAGSADVPSEQRTQKV